MQNRSARNYRNYDQNRNMDNHNQQRDPERQNRFYPTHPRYFNDDYEGQNYHSNESRSTGFGDYAGHSQPDYEEDDSQDHEFETLSTEADDDDYSDYESDDDNDDDDNEHYYDQQYSAGNNSNRDYGRNYGANRSGRRNDYR